MKIYTYQGKKERFRRENTSDEKYETDVTIRTGCENAG